MTLEKDKKYQSKYYLHYTKPRVLDRMGKHFKVSSFTKWRLGENVSLWLMECLTPNVSFDIFMDNYFTPFHLLTHLGVNKIRATRVLNKNRLSKCTIIGYNQLQKEERGHFEQRTSSKKAV